MFSDQAIGYSRLATALLKSDTPIPVIFNGVCSKMSAVNGYPNPEGNEYLEKYVKRYKKETPLMFMRECVRVSKEQHEEWEIQVTRDSLRLIEDVEEAIYSRNAPDACTVFGVRCQFLDLCKMANPAGRTLVADKLYEKESWHGWEIEWED